MRTIGNKRDFGLQKKHNFVLRRYNTVSRLSACMIIRTIVRRLRWFDFVCVSDPGRRQHNITSYDGVEVGNDDVRVYANWPLIL